MTEIHESGLEIVSTRIFDVSPEVLFRAWTDPELLKEWWGPKGFTNTFYEFDPKPGGKWEFTMHGPNGADYENSSEFVEVVEPRRIVFDHKTPPKFRLIAVFEPKDGKTGLIFRMIFAGLSDLNKVKPVAPKANEENFDKLEALLAKQVL